MAIVITAFLQALDHQSQGFLKVYFYYREGCSLKEPNHITDTLESRETIYISDNLPPAGEYNALLVQISTPMKSKTRMSTSTFRGTLS